MAALILNILKQKEVPWRSVAFPNSVLRDKMFRGQALAATLNAQAEF